jgi:hypothetical protein
MCDNISLASSVKGRKECIWKLCELIEAHTLLLFDVMDGEAGCRLCSSTRLFIMCLPFYIIFYDPIRASTQPSPNLSIKTSLLAVGSVAELKKFENSEVGLLKYYLLANNLFWQGCSF